MWMREQKHLKVGQVFGRLTAVEPEITERIHHARAAKLICTCGQTVLRRIAALGAASEDNCGCKMKNPLNHSAELLTDEERIVTATIISYRNNDKKSDRTFSLTRDNVRDLIFSPCYYSGYLGDFAKIHEENKVISQKWRVTNIKSNGIDRLDSSIGHVPGNCVSCSRVCNHMKRNLTVYEFVTWIRRFSAYQNNMKQIRINTSDPHRGVTNGVFGQYKFDANKRGIAWALTKEDIDNIVYKDCYFCGFGGNPTTENYLVKHWKTKNIPQPLPVCNGVDRIDNSRGYTRDNCVTCCRVCNHAKWNLSETEFKEWVYLMNSHTKDWYLPNLLVG